MLIASRDLASTQQYESPTMTRSIALGSLTLALALAGNAGASEAVASHTRPEPLKSDTCRQPEYPALSIQSGDEGEGVYGVQVKADGTVAAKAILLSSGHRALDQEVLVSLSRCSFRPGVAGGKPVDMWYLLQYQWTLNSEDAAERLTRQASRRAAKGDPAARYQQSLLFAQAKDPVRALASLRSAAELGHPMAQFALARQLETGVEVERDPQSAMAWYQKAAAGGNGPAIERLHLGGLPLAEGERRQAKAP